MSGAPQQQDAEPPSSRRALGILAFAVVGFVALVIFGLGMVSLATGEAVVDRPGLTQVPGILATCFAAAAFAALTAPALLRGWAGLGSAALSGVAGLLGYLAGIFLGAVGAVDPAVAAGVVGRLATSWFALVIVVAGLLAGVGAAVTLRAGSGRARWPWESDDE